MRRARVMTLAPNDQMRGGLDEAQWRERFRSFTDPLRRLEAYLRDHPYLEERERSVLATRERELRTGLRRSRTPRGRARRAADLAGWRRKMRFAGILALLAVSALATAAHAELFRCTGPDGKTIFTDQKHTCPGADASEPAGVVHRAETPEVPSATRTSFPRRARANRRRRRRGAGGGALEAEEARRRAAGRADPRAARLDPEVRGLLQPGRLGHHARRGGHPAGRQLHGIAPRVHTRSKRRRRPRASTSPRVSPKSVAARAACRAGCADARESDPGARMRVG